MTKYTKLNVIAVALTMAAIGCSAKDNVSPPNPDAAKNPQSPDAARILPDASTAGVCAACDFDSVTRSNQPSGGVVEVRQGGFGAADCSGGYDRPADSAAAAGALCTGVIGTAPAGQCAFTKCVTTTCCGTRAYAAAWCKPDDTCATGTEACDKAKAIESTLDFCQPPQ
jgi:hypothetical protein